MSSPLSLVYYPEPLAIHRLAPDATTIARVAPLLETNSNSVVSLTVTPSEFSVILPAVVQLPPEISRSEIQTETGWRAFAISGQLDFALVGVLVKVIGPLKDAAISVFTLSTYDTDWVLVKENVV
ncbi:ACT domain-containing protein, partial [Gaertneriomyces semiglobifer]